MLSKPQQKRLNADRDWAIKDFYLRNNQLYYTAEKLYGPKVVAITYNAAQHVIHAHEVTGHTDICKTH